MPIKICHGCRTEKELSDFNNKRSSKDGKQPLCRDCSKERSKKYYRDNTKKHLKDVYRSKLKRLKRNRIFIYEYLSNHPCIDCGEVDPIILEFDHRQDKKFNVSNMVSSVYSIKSLYDEIQKCDVRCANCHRRKTAHEVGHYMLTMGR